MQSMPPKTALRGVFVALAIALSATGAHAQDRLSLRLDYLPTGYVAPLFYAEKMGWYDEAGIDLTIEDGQGSNAALQAIAAGNNDVVIANYATMVLSVSQGMDLIAIGGVIQRLPDSVLSLAANPVSKPEDLVGKSLATTITSASHKLLMAFLNVTGVDPEKIEFVGVPAGQGTVALLAEQVDVATGWPLTETYNITQQKEMAPPMPFADYGINVLGNGFVTTRAFAEANGDLLSRFMAVTVRAYEESLADPEAAIAAIVEARPLLSTAKVMPELTDLPPLMHSANSEGQPLFVTVQADWEQTVQILRDYFEMTGDIDIGRVYTNDFLPY